MTEITTELIDKLFNKRRIKGMLDARRYYDNDNDIARRKRTVVGPFGEPVEAKLLSNNRLSHSFIKKIVRQKVTYLMGKPFNIDGEDKALVDKMRDICDKDFQRMLRKVAKDAILCGDGWIIVYYNENGELKFMRVKPECIAAVYSDENEDSIEAVIRRYRKSDEKASKFSDSFIKYDDNHVMFDDTLLKSDDKWLYEVWTKDGVTTYRKQNGKVSKVNERKHFMGGKSDGFGMIPMVRFRYNDEGRGILDTVKPLIDNYDLVTSDMANLLSDTPNAMRIIKGYRGSVEELIRNLSTFNTACIDPESSIETLQNSVDIQAHEAHLARLRKDIYDVACAVDTQEASQGDLSGVAIKFRYADLDLDCQEMGNSFAASLENLAEFVCFDMEHHGEGKHNAKALNVIWATEMVANDAEIIQNLMNSADLLSLESRVAQHPYVDDPKEEMKRIKKEKKDAEDEVPGEYQSGRSENVVKKAPNSQQDASDGEGKPNTQGDGQNAK